MTASKYLKGVALEKTRSGSLAMVACAIVAWTPAPISVQAAMYAIIALTAAWMTALWFAWWYVWRAEHESAIESIYLTEGTAQMQRKIIEQRNEIEKLKRNIK